MSCFVELPDFLIAVPGKAGYFYHLLEKELYSLKQSGTLRKLKKHKVTNHNVIYHHSAMVGDCYWCVSVAGVRRHIYLDYLERLHPTKSKIPYHEGNNHEKYQ